MTFKKGQIVKVKFSETSEGYERKFRGEFEVIRTGRRFYLFSNDYGKDWHPSKAELEKAITDYLAS
jgi:hypothetical protein